MNKFELYFIYCMNCLGIILLGGFMTYVYYLANKRYIIVVIGISICLLISICLFFMTYVLYEDNRKLKQEVKDGK